MENKALKRLAHTLWEHKWWWLIPMLTVFAAFGALVWLAGGAEVAPFTYVLF